MFSPKKFYKSEAFQSVDFNDKFQLFHLSLLLKFIFFWDQYLRISSVRLNIFHPLAFSDIIADSSVIFVPVILFPR